MFTIILCVFVVSFVISIIWNIRNSSDCDGGLIISTIAGIVIFFLLIFGMCEYNDAKKLILSIQSYQSVIDKGYVVQIKPDTINAKLVETYIKSDNGTVVSNRLNQLPRSTSYIQEQAWKYNEMLLVFKDENTWISWKLFLPKEISTVEPLK